MITPCVNICQLVDGRCRGCGRTLEDIAKWSAYTDQQRQAVMERLSNEKHTGR
jgi:predicted Fe-S protein YdhL (DUF1289 family)